MGWRFTPLAVGLLALTGAVFGLGAYLLLRRRGSTRRRLAVITGVVMVTAAVWVAAYALGLSATDRGGMLFWVRVQYITTTALPLLWLAFVDEYVDRELGLTRRRWAALTGVPLIGLALVYTNGQHGLAWSAAEVVTVQGTVTMTFTYGPAYYLHSLYALGIVFAALAFLIGAFVRAEGAYRRQTGMLLASVAFPITGSVLDVSGLNPYAPLDLAVFGFIGAVAGVALTVQRHQLFSLVPVGRETAVNQLPDPLVVLDDGDRILEVNPAARELAAVDRDLVGCTLDELPAENPLREVLTVPGRTEFSVESEGRLRHLNRSVTPLSDGSGEHVGRLVLLRDVTDRKERELQLERQNETLAEFSSMVTHDLQSPLGVAVGFLELARETHDEEDFEKVEGALHRMGTIIDELLALARQGRTVSETERVSLAAFAREAWGNVATDDVELVVADDRRIDADPERLLQVYENLFSNAVEHGRPTTVTVGPTDGGFYVADDGEGIPPGERDRVFQEGVTTAEDGTGYGLAIVERIVDAHDWDIHATESGAGGARFEVTDVPGVPASVSGRDDPPDSPGPPDSPDPREEEEPAR